MPNWCQNHLVASGSVEAIKEFLFWLDDGKNLLSKIIPIPLELANGSFPFTGSKEESAALIEKYGADNGYDWTINNWGTKWDVIESDVQDIGHQVGLTFQTAWAPPERAIALLAKMFSNLNFSLAYLEEGMCLAGRLQYDGGKLISEFYSEDPEDEEWQQLARNEFGWEPFDEEE